MLTKMGLSRHGELKFGPTVVNTRGSGLTGPQTEKADFGTQTVTLTKGTG